MMVTTPAKAKLVDYGLNIALGIAVLVALFMIYASLQSLPERWARISEFHASWNPWEHTVDLSFLFEKERPCVPHSIVVEKTVSPILEGVIGRPAIVLKGDLNRKLEAAPLGPSSQFDQAIPASPLKPGDYSLVLAASCQVVMDSQVSEPQTIELETTDTVQVRLTVYELDPKLQRRNGP